MASEYAWSRQDNDRPEQCSTLKDNNQTQTNCMRCVEGYGDQIITLDPITGAESRGDAAVPKLPGGINPSSFFFTMVSISVLFQAITFISIGAMGDYGNFRRRGLVAASTFGGLVTCCYIFVPASSSLYWLGGVLIMLANISLGVSVVFYNSYLPLMVDDSPEVREAIEAASTGLKGEDDVRAAQEKASSEYSSKGQMWGYIGGTTCLVLSFIVITVLTILGVSNWWALGIGSALSGVWWLAFSAYSFVRLPERPGPPVPKDINILTIGWVRTYRLLAHVRKEQPKTALFLILFFFFSDGYTTIATVSVIFASRELCLGIVTLSAMAMIVPLFAAVGGWAWFKIQCSTGWSTKSVLVLNLCLLAILPMWGCIGYFSEDVGLRTAPEMYVLAVWFGFFLGAAQAYGRALFSELIPQGHEADMFALFEITDKGSSWLGPLVTSIILQQTGKIRPVLIYLLCAMVVPALMLHHLDLSGSIESARMGAKKSSGGGEEAEEQNAAKENSK